VAEAADQVERAASSGGRADPVRCGVPMGSTALVDLGSLDADAREQLARITLPAAREHAPDWLPGLDAARGQVADALAPGKIARVALDGGVPVGWVAAGHAWGCVWELHPPIVAIEHQRCGHGRRLVREIERLAVAAGARTMTLGTGDTTGATSLAGVDLYDDTFARLARVEVRRPHAVELRSRIGYQIVVGVPDAEGPGKPSITLARRLPDNPLPIV
jgi:aminoglycoside 6'-N-acetyltransferase I